MASSTAGWVLYRPTGLSLEVTKILLTAERLGIKLDVRHVLRPEDIPTAGTGFAFRLPVLRLTQKGQQLFGAQAIVRYLARSRPAAALYGDSFQDQGEVDSWLEWMQNELEAAVATLAQLQQQPPEERLATSVAQAGQQVIATLRVLDAHLLNSTYLVGHHPTVADLSGQAALRHLQDLDVELFRGSGFRNVLRWFDLLEAQLPQAAGNAKALAPGGASGGSGGAAGGGASGGGGGGGGKKDGKPGPDGKPKADKAEGKPDGKDQTKGQPKAKAAAPAATAAPVDGQADTKGITTKKSDDFSLWYTQVITKSEMIEYYDISGCYILRPWAFFIWEQITEWFDSRIKELGVQNSYFPFFVSQEALEAEKDHVEGFAPEVAWVTKSGTSELAKPIAIRPTSETIMYPAYAKWIRSHRDLPLKLNQWTSVVRWEFKQPTPFLRTREFLWQEGHTAHATREEAMEMVLKILDLYAGVYQELLAVPVVRGVKSEEEKFAGGYKTTTVEAFIPANGRGIQAATSHHLGNNFAKMFGIDFEDEKGEKRLVEQTSWGLTTRSIGIMTMVHSDDNGLVLPPRVAPIQVIIIPIPMGKADPGLVDKRAEELQTQLAAAGIRTDLDKRSNYTPGWKYNWWEMKGVPLRMELGPKDMEKGSCRLVRRDTGAKMDVQQSEVVAFVREELDRMHADMLRKATEERDRGIAKVTEWSEVMPALNQRKLVLAPWCETVESEEAMKKATKEASGAEATQVSTEEGAAPALTGAMKSLCIPLEQPPMPPGTKCFFTGEPAKRWCLFGRSY